MKNTKSLGVLFVAAVASFALFAASCSDVVTDADWSAKGEASNIVFTFNAPVSLSKEQISFSNPSISAIELKGAERVHTLSIVASTANLSTTVTINAEGISSRPRTLSLTGISTDTSPLFSAAVYNGGDQRRGMELRFNTVLNDLQLSDVIIEPQGTYLDPVKLTRSTLTPYIWHLDYSFVKQGTVQVIVNKPGYSENYVTYDVNPVVFDTTNTGTRFIGTGSDTGVLYLVFDAPVPNINTLAISGTGANDVTLGEKSGFGKVWTIPLTLAGSGAISLDLDVDFGPNGGSASIVSISVRI